MGDNPFRGESCKGGQDTSKEICSKLSKVLITVGLFFLNWLRSLPSHGSQWFKSYGILCEILILPA